MKLTSYQEIKDNVLTHSGISYKELAERYQTPLYIIDEDHFRNKIEAYKKAFTSDKFQTRILYASKALLTKAIATVVADAGIGQDVVSGGEIYTGVVAGIDPSKMYFHGNNKSNDDLNYAINAGVGTIVLDNQKEAERLEGIAARKKRKVRVLLRLNPTVHTDTHKHIQTANEDSKFGIYINDPKLFRFIQALADSPHFEFAGFHSHIGSQIFDEKSFYEAAETLLFFSKKVEQEQDIKIKELNFGGGFGVYYSQGDEPFDVVEFLPDFVKYVEEKEEELGLELETISIEPGRSLINDSGSTLYTIGDTKQTPSGLNYAFVDGGMSDNIRPALYEAKYEACVPYKINEEASYKYNIAGKLCESGDYIIKDYNFPELEAGDLLLVNRTGAYNYSMASNYNRLPRPAMVHIRDGEPHLTVKRETYADLLNNEF